MNNPSLNGSKTAQNLEAAFAGESMANRKYLYFAKLARELGNTEVADLFEDIARDGELYETNEMYPGFEKQALEEGNTAAVAEFKEQAAESLEHANIFNRAARRFGALKKVEALHAAEYDEALQNLKAGNAVRQAG